MSFITKSKFSIVITGGGSGIGNALAKRLSNNGHEVIIVGRRLEQLEKAREECPALVLLQGDVGTAAGRKQLADTVIKDYPQVDILINNAGIQNRLPPLYEPQDWQNHEDEISINFSAPIHLSNLLLPHLVKKPVAAIINVTSGLAFVPMALMPTYCATKAAAHSFTLSLRQQLLNTSVKVIEIIPPAVKTDLGGKGLHDMGENLDEFADHVIQKLEESDDNVEFGFKFAETARNASREQINGIFQHLNKSH